MQGPFTAFLSENKRRSRPSFYENSCHARKTRGVKEKMPSSTIFTELPGGPGKDNKSKEFGFNDIPRKRGRELLYNNIKQVLRKRKNITPYDQYWVINLIRKQIRNGKI